jgi:hypothetical protein
MIKRQWITNVLISFSVSSALILTGCASTGSNEVEPDSRLTEGDSAEFFSKSGFQACAGGAAIGVVGCALSNSGNKAGCAIAAGIVACGVAMGANYYYDDRRSKYSNTTQRLQAMTGDVKNDTQKVAMRTEAMQGVISDDEKTLAEINQSIKSKQLDKAKATTELAQIDKNIALMRKDVTAMQAKSTEYKKTADLERKGGAKPAEMASLDAEISQLNTKIASLNKEVDGLYNQRSAITLGA